MVRPETARCLVVMKQIAIDGRMGMFLRRALHSFTVYKDVAVVFFIAACVRRFEKLSTFSWLRLAGSIKIIVPGGVFYSIVTEVVLGRRADGHIFATSPRPPFEGVSARRM